MLYFGGLTIRDIGLKKEKILPAVLGALTFWVVLNIFVFLIEALSHSGSTLNQTLLTEPGIILGNFMGQLFGNAFLEEVVFRGFLFVHLYLLLKKAGKSRILYALLLSQTIFALMHLPNRIYSGLNGIEFVFDFTQLLLIGLLFSLIYYLTDNLFLLIGLHSLLNSPPMIWSSQYTSIIALTMLLLLPILLKYLKRKSTFN